MKHMVRLSAGAFLGVYNGPLKAPPSGSVSQKVTAMTGAPFWRDEG